MPSKETQVQRLREVPLFRSLTSGQLESLDGCGADRFLLPREVLYRQGDPASSSYVVLSGTVQLTVALGPEKATAGLVSPNEVFGFEALMNKCPRRVNAVANNRVRILELNGRRLKEFLIENPRFQLELLRHVISILHRQALHTARTGHYDAEQRVASYLIETCDRDPARSGRLNRHVSQADIADYLALTPETFSRKISKFRRLGWIENEGEEYVIRQHESLRGLLDR